MLSDPVDSLLMDERDLALMRRPLLKPNARQVKLRVRIANQQPRLISARTAAAKLKLRSADVQCADVQSSRRGTSEILFSNFRTKMCPRPQRYLHGRARNYHAHLHQ